MAQRNQTHFYDSLLNRNFIEGTFGKKVCVFGSGRFAEKFISQYGDNCDVVQVVDNDSSKWNSDFHGIKISSPSTLSNISDDICLVICVKDYKPIYNQLLSINIKNIVLYDAHKNYSVGDLKDGENKKYHVGYLSGVFDLYHIGHINMFRRAKEMCDYLIVGVTSDEYVLNKKKKTPFIPCEERMQVIQACKYVDKVVKVPYLHEEITEAWNTYHYDVQFCGSDYENNPWWLEQQKWLREHGADLVFFPYTEQTNSTKIKALIEKGLL
ncbi:MAG: adenylyltransferase/cytidyltransferase family protein [Clostridiales bacterium]|nr:adenylyltransferase/cytidyltransferase family protein [Clostridiales bacterium]